MFKLENKLSKRKIKVLAILNMAAWHLLRPLECPNSPIFCDLTQIYLPDLNAQKALQRQQTMKDSDASQYHSRTSWMVREKKEETA